jgi:hypothetical protein
VSIDPLCEEYTTSLKEYKMLQIKTKELLLHYAEIEEKKAPLTALKSMTELWLPLFTGVTAKP